MFAFGEVLTCKSLSLLDMQKTAGKMQRAVMTFPRGAACLLVSMFALMCGLRLPWQRRRTTRTVRQDVASVIELLRLNLGKGYYSFQDFIVGPAMATDASRSRSYTGGGWFSFCGLYDFWVYGSRAARQGIDYLEGDVIVVAVKRMAHKWFGKRITFFVDNLVFEKSGEAGRSRVERLNVLLKELFMLQIIYNFIIEWFWIDTHSNKLSDHLSRGREDEFLRDAHGGDTERLASEYNRIADDSSRGYGEGASNAATGDPSPDGSHSQAATWLSMPTGVTPRRIDGEVGRTRVLPEVRGQITDKMLSEAAEAARVSQTFSRVGMLPNRGEGPGFEPSTGSTFEGPGFEPSAGSALLIPKNEPEDVGGEQGETYAQRAMRAAGGGGMHVRGGKALMTLMLLTMCGRGESARPESASHSVADAVAAASYTRSSIFDGLPADMLPQVEQIMDNRLSSSSWQKINTALKSWRAFASERGWEVVIKTDDPMRGGKLAAWVTSLVALTSLVYASISKYVWGLCTWMTLQHQADPRVAVPEWRVFMAATKVLTFVPAKPHDRWKVDNLERVLRNLDPSKFEDVQLAVLLLILFYTFARTETPLSKTRGGRECYDPEEDLAWGDVRLRRDRSTRHELVTEVRFKKVKTDQRMERAEARGDGDWRIVGQVDDELWNLATWYLRLIKFHGRKRGAAEPFFIDPSLVPEDASPGEAWMFRDAEPEEAWLYRDALAAAYAAQRAAGVPESELAAFHGIRVEAWNLSRKGNGEAISGAHGGWTSKSGRRRYDRFKPGSAQRIAQNMLRARVSDFSGSESDGSGDSQDDEVVSPRERAATAPASRLNRSQLRSPGAGSSSSPAGDRGQAAAPVAAAPVAATPASAGSARKEKRKKQKKPVEAPAARTPTVATSGPVPRGVELGDFVTFDARPSTRRAPAARART